MLTLAADVGGTFIDLTLIDGGRGRVLIDKVPSGARGSARPIAAGIRRIAASAGVTPADIDLFVHGFTVPTNAFLMRAGARAALVTGRGFADTLEIGNQMRPRTYALAQTKPAPVIQRSRVIEVGGRIDAFGTEVEPLGEAEIARAVAAVGSLEPESVAISLLFSFLAPAHEQALAAALGRAFPGLPVYASHLVNPQLEEWPRASTTAMAAYVGPVVARYLDELEATLAELGFRGSLRLMRSDGSVATARAARENPGHMLTSGLAGGVIAAHDLCRRLDVAHAITLDVGGTSADFSVIVGGEVQARMSRVLDGQPLRLPTLDVETLSNGGGTIAWIDPGGRLRVGPLSAGAVPGPACYATGGERATVTDAAVVLGWLAPEDYLGGEVRIEPELARGAIERDVARPLGLSLEAAAFGVIRIANAQLVQSIRSLCVERGLDPREMALIAFGGAGPLYASLIARDLSLAEAIAPRHPGVFAAAGLLAADIGHRLQRPFARPLERIEVRELSDALDALAAEATAELAADGVPHARCRIGFQGDLRYVGQFHELLVELPDYRSRPYAAAELADRFHDVHRRRYGHCDPAAPVEIVNLRVEGIGALDRPKAVEETAATEGVARAVRRRRVHLGPDHGSLEVPIYARGGLRVGQSLAGPAIVTQLDSTLVLMPGDRAEVVATGAIRVRQKRRA